MGSSPKRCLISAETLERTADADSVDLAVHPLYLKLAAANGKPLSPAIFVCILYNTMGDYHAMRDQPISQFSTALKIEAIRLLNASLSNLEGTTELEVASSILMLGGASMVSSCLFLWLPRNR